MSTVIHQYAFGGPDTLTVEQENVGEPGPGEVRLRQRAIGVNYIDLAFRAGALGGGDFPLTLGVEGAGEVDAVGSGVTDFRTGERVAYPIAPGAYAEERILPAATLVHLASEISFEQAAAITTKGMLAGTLLEKVYPLKEGDVILVHAAAGGVGSLLTRWAKARGARVIGTVGSPAKVAAAKANGVDDVFVLGSGDIAGEISRITGGKGVAAVFDGVGQATVDLTLDAVADGGTVAMFGNASGPATPDPDLVARKRIKLSQPDLGTVVPDQAGRQAVADKLFTMVGDGSIPAPSLTTYPLSGIADAHRDLESGKTTGSLVLTV
jgi:NADPH2:quinone reductase